MPEGKLIDDIAGQIIPVSIDETRTWYLRGHSAEAV